LNYQRASQAIVAAIGTKLLGQELWTNEIIVFPETLHVISASEYRRRMASLTRAEAVRGPFGQPVSSLSIVAMARRCFELPDRGGVDPVTASRVNDTPWLLRR
jgi:hypothetical protein